MLADPPDDRVRDLWRRLAGAPDAFTDAGVVMVSGDEARVTRPGWCGVVALGDAALVTVPSLIDWTERLLGSSSLSPEALTDPDRVAEVIGPLASTLGPADLQYGFVHGPMAPHVTGPAHFGDSLVQETLAAIPDDDRSEAGFGDASIESVFVAIAGDRPVAVAGYRVWEDLAAHIGVATTPATRRMGHGRAAAHAAAAHATSRGLVVQWRSLWSNDASRELGRSLGLIACGRQFSFQPDANIEIRPRTEADLVELAEVAARVHQLDGYPIFLPGGDTRRFLERPEPVAAWIAELDGRTVGHVALNATTSKPTMELVEATEPSRSPIYVARLLVDPNARRRGIARLLLDTALAAAADRGHLAYLDVVDIESAAPALVLYRRSGWTEIGRVNFDLAGEDIEELVFRAPSRTGDRT